MGWLDTLAQNSKYMSEVQRQTGFNLVLTWLSTGSAVRYEQSASTQSSNRQLSVVLLQSHRKSGKPEKAASTQTEKGLKSSRYAAETQKQLFTSLLSVSGRRVISKESFMCFFKVKNLSFWQAVL